MLCGRSPRESCHSLPTKIRCAESASTLPRERADLWRFAFLAPLETGRSPHNESGGGSRVPGPRRPRRRSLRELSRFFARAAAHPYPCGIIDPEKIRANHLKVLFWSRRPGGDTRERVNHSHASHSEE